MNIEELLKVGAAAFNQAIAGQSGATAAAPQVAGALGGLLGNGQGGFDVAGLIEKFSSSGLLDLARGWLGGGQGAGIGVEQLLAVFGQSQIGDFARRLGLDPETALSGLQQALPAIVGRVSTGDLLGSFGGLSGMLGAAGSLFGR